MHNRSGRIDLDLLSEIPQLLTSESCVVTIGTFDGFHQGHRAVVAATRATADSLDCRAVAVTFHPRPETVLRPHAALPDVVSVEDRVDCLLAAGMDSVVVLRFSRELAQLSADQFIGRLRALLSIETLCVGADFAFGRNKAVSVPAIAAMGLPVQAVPLVPGMDEKTKASSTNIRQAIARGIDRRRAAALA